VKILASENILKFLAARKTPKIINLLFFVAKNDDSNKFYFTKLNFVILSFVLHYE
jgi:hypothetical protein